MNEEIYTTINNYGVVFERLHYDDLELVRGWRNSKEVSKNMIYQKTITSSEQEEWFESINNNNNFYYVVSYKGNKIALVNIKNVDFEIGTGECGCFIGVEEYRTCGLGFPILAAMLDFAFDVLYLKKIYSHVLKSNVGVLRFNLRFGFQICPDDEQDSLKQGAVRLSLTRENYGCNISHIRELFGNAFVSNGITK